MTLLKTEMDYLKELAGAGLDGIAAARREFHGPVFETAPNDRAWKPAAICAGIGIVSGGLVGKRGNRSRVAVGGLVGSLLGSAALLAWTSRRFARAATLRAVRSVNAVRDQRWLKENPIDYA